MNGESEISHRRSTVPAPNRAGDRLVGRRIVTIGGGSGTFSVLSHMKKYSFNISAIVTMSDSGGSSRMLMDEFRRQLPLGDLRQSLVALARNGALWREVFMHRFEQSDETDGAAQRRGVSGHSLGNLILKGLQDINNGDLLLAIEDARGKNNLNDLSPIKQLRLVPPDAPGCAQALRAIRRADTIIIGPGDLYTSLIPNLLVSDIARAVRESDAEKVYICNLMTKHGETDSFKASDFVSEIHRYLGVRVDRVIVNNGSFLPDLLKTYAEERSEPVVPDRVQLTRLVPNVTIEQLNLEDDRLARHDPERLVRAIFSNDDL